MQPLAKILKLKLLLHRAASAALLLALLLVDTLSVTSTIEVGVVVSAVELVVAHGLALELVLHGCVLSSAPFRWLYNTTNRQLHKRQYNHS